MRATEEHTAAVAIPAPPPPAPATAAEDAEKEKRKNRRRPARRSKQAGAAVAPGPGLTQADAAGPRSCRSMPPMHVGNVVQADAGVEAAAAGTSQSCALLLTPSASDAAVRRMGAGGAAERRYFQPHWPERAVEEAVKVFSCFMGGLQLRGRDFV